MAKIVKPPYFEAVVNAGEVRLLEYLEANLPDNYYLIPNVEIASTNPRNSRTQYWEYDLIVVAPHAIYNIENKDWKGRIEGDDSYWYLNDRRKPNPLKNGRQKTAILASKLKDNEFEWGKAWVQNMVTLSFPNTYTPSLWQEAGKLTFQLNEKLVEFITNPCKVGKVDGAIADIRKDIVEFLIGKQSKKAPNEKREVEGYEIIEVLQQEPNFTEYLVKPKGVTTSIRKRVKEFSLQVSGLSPDELLKREEIIKNQYKALHKIKAKPFILNVEFKIDEENHLFYEISDFLDENSLRAEARSKTFTFQEKISIIRNLMAALEEAHKENIYHRDINPDNVYMSSGYAYLGNFGKSYFTDHYKQGYTVMATINEINATPYHPLELTEGDASRSSDIYSLGVLIYWLFTGEEPFNTPYDLDKLGGRIPDYKLPSNINNALPKWLDELCHKTILTDDLKRIDNIGELAQFINEAVNGSQTGLKVTEKNTERPNVKDVHDLKEGDRVGAYVIHEILGKGGYSKVFKVKHSIQEKYFAMKLFHESVNAQSVKDEYNALKDLNHNNIVKFVWNDVLPTGQFFTVMEYLDGENLSMYTRTDARLPIYRVYQVAKDILSALVSMQNMPKPILHRDIKPHNIIWDNQERFVLIDFNVASFAEDNKDFVGTNPFLAPDLITDNYKVDWDRSADTFALGITLYELICKQHPWAPGKLPLISKDPLPPRTIEDRLSEEFEAFIMKAISSRGDNRFKDAKEMLDALLSIGEEGVLEKKAEKEKPIVEIEKQVDVVNYINSLYSQSKYGNSGTRASFSSNVLDESTYTPTKLDKHLLPAILDGKYKLVIITGNAGDGKTAFIRKIEEDKNISNLKRFNNKNGARFEINSTVFESNYDGSQDEEDCANNEVLERFFRPFENMVNYSNAKEGRIIAINEGRLVEFLKTTKQHKRLNHHIEDYFYNEGHYELPEGLMIINLNLRSVVAESDGIHSLFRQQVKALTSKELWGKCEECPVAHKCFIKYNVDSFNDTACGEEVITRMEWLLKTASLKRELHITIRDLRSFIAYTITRDHVCNDIESLYTQNSNAPENYWQYYYFNITNRLVEDSGNQDRLIKLLRETDIGEVAVPDLDRDLFFGKHLTKHYLEFAEREISLLDDFNSTERIKPAYEQNDNEVARIIMIQKSFIRHQYFEGKAELLSVQNGDVKDNSQEETSQLPSYLLRLPYHSVFKLAKVLDDGDIDNHTKISISRAISLNEGCDNPGIYKEYLVLSSTEIKDPLSKSFRLFNLNDFELFVNRSKHLLNYLEYEPDSLIFRHKKEKHIKLTISLDLYEMLFFIQQGFSPSLNDLRGKFVELIIFKNLLKNLSYSEVVVTKDNIEFFRISVGGQNYVQIQKMEV
ncbi:protein kinase [Bacillus sp. EB106-08-02-XG196]|uniref:methylation-associated defense system protein kinase MAD6 n=1 Tax=Bacillus sp. EB106-08-02-XG196 TaxID=2737049 RepID=UPI0015C46402|nr:serine/threonine protein kinase [Bacillus sp. EB106-08-02-XG196]NWQ43321.1 protein kinase [Bacillus sp. EB106-08-02-XG196]